MSKTSITMLPSSQGQLNLTGEPIRADGWYGFTDGLHTVAIYLQNFQGRVLFEGSIANEPTESDWFPIEVQFNGASTEFLSFPKDPLIPTGTTGDTGTMGLNIVGSFTWLRARIDRSHISPQPENISQIDALGVVDRILLNH